MITLAACLVGMVFFGVTGSSLRSSPQDTIAKVNGQNIKKIDFDRLYNHAIRQRPDLKPEDRPKLASDVLNELIRQNVMAQEAKKYGIHVSDRELQVYLSNLPAFQRDGKFDPQTYYQTVARIFEMTPNEFEKIRKKDIAAFKLNQLIALSVHVPEQTFRQAYKRRLAIETDSKERKALKKNPEKLRKELRNQEVNRVMKDWLGQLNTQLKVRIVSKDFQDLLSGRT